MKKTVGFRLSEDARDRLSVLSKAWGCTRTDVLERLLGDPESPAWHPSYPSEEEQAARQRLPPVDPPKPITRAEREAKIEAMQRKMARSK